MHTSKSDTSSDMPKPLHPCPWMTTLLSGACDNTLAGLLRRFTEWHVRYCPRCRAALAALQALRERLQSLTSSEPLDRLAPGRWEQLEAAWAEADRRV